MNTTDCNFAPPSLLKTPFDYGQVPAARDRQPCHELNHWIVTILTAVADDSWDRKCVCRLAVAGLIRRLRQSTVPPHELVADFESSARGNQ